MTTVYELTYKTTLPLLQRAMTSWSRPYIPRQQRILRLGLVVAGSIILGILFFVVGVLNIFPKTLILGVFIGIFLGLMFWMASHKRDGKRILNYGATQLRKQGETKAKFSAEGVEITINLGTTHSAWAAYDQVIMMDDATALQAGGTIYPVPHDALPIGVDAATFDADLTRWQKGAA